MPIYPNIYQTLLPGPIVELRGYLAACGLRGRLYAYLNYNGPTGTARDELAEGMLALALERGALTPGQTIVEAVSGPFATALTLAGLTAGHPVTLVMPEDAPAMRQESLLRLGAQIIHTPAQAGPAGARALAKATAAEKGWYYMDWLNNDDNPTYHRRVTGPALVRSIAREGSSIVDSIVIGVGSGGTITGVGETVKAWTNDVRIVAVDNIAAVTTADAVRAAQRVLRTDAIPASPSAGAALHAAAQLIANGKSRSALAVFSARQNIL